VRRGWFVLACVLGVAALGAAYSNHFDNGFHFDDSHVIVNNLSIRNLQNLPRFFTDPHTFTARPQNAVYRPLLTTSYAIDYRIAGALDPGQFHRTQFGLLLLLGALLVVFFRRVLELALPAPSNRYVAVFAATLFCIHTANTQTVNYLSARSSLAATLGVVGSFVIFLSWPQGRKTLIYLLPMVAGALAKPLAVMFAPLLLVFVWLFEADRGGRPGLAAALRRTAPAFVAAVALFAFLRSMDAETLEYAQIDRWTYARTQPFVWVHYFRLFLLPVGLTADTDWSFLTSWLDSRLLLGSLFLAALGTAIGRLSKSRRLRPAAFGLAWFAIALLPTSSIVPLSEVYNEHRIFFPFVGLALAFSWAAALALRALARRSSRIAGVAAVGLALTLVAAHGIGTYQRNRVWKNATTLWRDVTLKSPQNGRGMMNYGLTLMRAGRLEQALEHFERAAILTPDYSVLEINLGIVNSALGHEQLAERHFRRALQLTPDYAQGRYYYADWLRDHGRCPEAIEQLERALEISPGDVDSNRLLLHILFAMGDEAALRERAQRVLALDPSHPIARAYSAGRVPFDAAEETAAAYTRLALQEFQAEQWLDAAVLYRYALKLDATSARTRDQLGRSLVRLGFDE